MNNSEKAKLLRSLQSKFDIGDVICLTNGDTLPMEDFISWIYERKDIAEQAIDGRKREFGMLLKPFYEDQTYPRVLLSEFFVYWSEPNKKGDKLRFEMEKTWSLPGRLRTFARNSKYKIKLAPSEMDLILDDGIVKTGIIQTKDLF